MRRTVIVFAVISFACACPAACARAEEVARGPSTDPALEAFKSREGFRFGVGGECAGGGVAFDVRAFARLNYAASPALELHADLLVGGSFVGPFLLAGLRGDVQLDLGSIIALSAGIDLAVSTGENGIMPGVGVHVSPLGFRFGEEREFMVAARVGGWVGDFDGISYEISGGLSYLFL